MSQVPNDPNFYNAPNPYVVSSLEQNQLGAAPRGKLPVFVMVMLIISLVFSLIRVLLVLLSIAGFYMMSQMEVPPPEFALAYAEVGTGIGIALFGVIGNSLMLAKKKVGFYFGVLLVLSVIGSIATGCFQANAMLAAYAPGTPEHTGAIVGFIFSVIVRLGILIAYGIALMQFWRWSQRNA